MTDDRFDNFPLMDMIQIRSTGKGFVVQSNGEAITMLVWCFVELWSPIQTRELVRQVIFFEPKGFDVGNVVSDDFFRVHGFKNVSVTNCSVQLQTKLFANDLQVVTLTDHNDVISCFIKILYVSAL